MRKAAQITIESSVSCARRPRTWSTMMRGISRLSLSIPAAQGQGLGRKLLEPTVAEADRVNATCYLETFSPRNLSFYERLGFSTKARFTEPTTGADYALMVRHPRPLTENSVP